MRYYYHTAVHDLGSSGVQEYSFGQLREILDIELPALDELTFSDSTSHGLDPLREVISARWGNGRVDSVMVTHGSSEAIYAAMTVLLEPGDQVIALDPIYHSLTSIAESIGCRIHRWSMRDDKGFMPNLDDLASMITLNPKMVVVNFPNNPTGRSLSDEDAGKLVSLVAASGAYLFWDAALSEIVYGRCHLPDPTTVYGRAISVGTFSKAYGLPGLRLGWCIAEPQVLAAMVRLRDRMTLSVSPIIEFLGLKAAQRADELLRPRMIQAEQNLGVLLRWAKENDDLIEITPPDGGVTVFPRLTGIEDTEPLCHKLGRDHGVLLVPGSCFGEPSRVRLGFGGEPRSFATGLQILTDLLQATRMGSRSERGMLRR
jgi:capreomycidine synthase